MTGLRVALYFLAFYLLLVALGQGLENYSDMQGGFRREMPRTICSPITGREIPVCVWDQYEAAMSAKEERWANVPSAASRP